jgi:GIY-YIG catalytic domain
MMLAGIYTITSPSGRKYIGQSINCARRIRQHQYDLRLTKHPNLALMRAYSKYEGRLTFTVECELPKEHLDQSAVISSGYCSDEKRARHSRAVRTARQADPTIVLRQAVSLRARYSKDPLLGVKMSASLVASYKADPTKAKRIAHSLSLTAANTREKRMVACGLLLFTEDGLRWVYNAAQKAYHLTWKPMPEQALVANALLRQIHRDKLGGAP